jgi:hypothetical protein
MKTMRFLIVLLLFSKVLCSQEVKNPEKIVQIQLEAYNRQDVKAFSATYADNVEIYNFGDAKPYLVGKENLEKSYASFFKTNPTNYASLLGRIVEGNYVIDKEKVTSDTYTFYGTAIYLVEKNLISKVWFLR